MTPEWMCENVSGTQGLTNTKSTVGQTRLPSDHVLQVQSQKDYFIHRA